jgi:mannose-6-phosphate isomerase-like protein (cupin superfamily)
MAQADLSRHNTTETDRLSVREFLTRQLPASRDVVAPDGSDVRILLGLSGGEMAHFELAPGQTSTAVAHRTVEEIWYFVAGRGEMWRRDGEREEVTPLEPEVCLTIPLGTHFQFRALGDTPLSAVAVTMPPWPGEGEAYAVEGRWEATVRGPM